MSDDDDSISRVLRAAIGNGLVWGATWAGLWVLAMVGFTLLGLLGIVPGFSILQAIGAAVRFGVPFGVIGFVGGGLFAGGLRLLYRGRGLSEISAMKVGLVGSVLGVLFVPLFLQTLSLLSGGGLMPWDVLYNDALLGGLFGGAAAGGSIKAAQMLPDGRRDELEGGGAVPSLPPDQPASGHSSR